MNRRAGADVPRVHRLEHVEDLAPPDLPDEDAVGPHAERVDQQVSLTDRAGTFHVWRAGFEPRQVWLLERARRHPRS